MLTEKRDEPSARSFFNKAVATHGRPTTVTIDKCGSNTAALKTLNDTLSGQQSTLRRSQYLNNRIVQAHRFIKRLTRPVMDFKSFASPVATLAGIELCPSVEKRPLPTS